MLGAARYGADHQVAGLLYAMQVPATIAKGRIAALSVDAAMQVPGVARVLTATDFLPPRLRPLAHRPCDTHGRHCLSRPAGRARRCRDARGRDRGRRGHPSDLHNRASRSPR
ncbi:MAG: hypothetical protein WKG07_20865 [Hymenobacter sp.]